MGRPSTPLLSQELIAAAALELVDGTGEFTVAQVASALKVRPSSLYNHVAGKAQIVEAMRALIFREVPAVAPDTDADTDADADTDTDADADATIARRQPAFRDCRRRLHRRLANLRRHQRQVVQLAYSSWAGNHHFVRLSRSAKQWQTFQPLLQLRGVA